MSLLLFAGFILIIKEIVMEIVFKVHILTSAKLTPEEMIKIVIDGLGEHRVYDAEVLVEEVPAEADNGNDN
jgi:hypothetical protein